MQQNSNSTEERISNFTSRVDKEFPELRIEHDKSRVLLYNGTYQLNTVINISDMFGFGWDELILDLMLSEIYFELNNSNKTWFSF